MAINKAPKGDLNIIRKVDVCVKKLLYNVPLALVLRKSGTEGVCIKRLRKSFVSRSSLWNVLRFGLFIQDNNRGTFSGQQKSSYKALLFLYYNNRKFAYRRLGKE